MKRFLIATTMLFAASSAYADDPQHASATDDEMNPAVADTLDTGDADTTPFTDDHAWVDTPVFGSDGAELGNVERVRLSENDEVDAIVIEYGGTLDIGGREVLIEAGKYMVTTVEGSERLELTYTMAEVEALPDFDEDRVSDYPLSTDESDEEDRWNESGIDDESGTGILAMDDGTGTAYDHADRDRSYALSDDPVMDRQGYTDMHAWIDTPAYGSDGSELGNVERVRLSADQDVEAVVIEYGGTVEVGGREVLIEAGNYRVATVDGEERLELTYTMAEVEALPAFDEDMVSDYPLSDSIVDDGSDAYEDEDEDTSGF